MSMATTALTRRRLWERGARRSWWSAAKPVRVKVSTVVVISGTANFRAVAFCPPMAKANRTVIAYRAVVPLAATATTVATATEEGFGDRDPGERSVIGQRWQPPADGGAGQKGPECH